MAFPSNDREALAAARMRVLELEVKEQEAIDHLVEVCRRAGIAVMPGMSWHDVVHHHADTIRDALVPFDSGVRCKGGS